MAGNRGQKIDARNEKGNEIEIIKGKCSQQWLIGTWNVRGLDGKEEEVEIEFERLGMHIIGMAETKKKGRGRYETKNGHVMIYSGVEMKERAAGG